MSLDVKVLLLEGLSLHIGLQEAFQCRKSFYEKYHAKHGLASEYVKQQPNRPGALAEYIKREQQVFERYVLMYAHHKAKPIYQVFTD